VLDLDSTASITRRAPARTACPSSPFFHSPIVVLDLVLATSLESHANMAIPNARELSAAVFFLALAASINNTISTYLIPSCNPRDPAASWVRRMKAPRRDSARRYRLPTEGDGLYKGQKPSSHRTPYAREIHAPMVVVLTVQ